MKQALNLFLIKKCRDIMDSPVKISVDPIKIFQKAGTKISDIIIEKCDDLSETLVA